MRVISSIPIMSGSGKEKVNWKKLQSDSEVQPEQIVLRNLITLSLNILYFKVQFPFHFLYSNNNNKTKEWKKTSHIIVYFTRVLRLPLSSFFKPYKKLKNEESCGLWLGGSHTSLSFPDTSSEWTNGHSSSLKTLQHRSSILRKTKRAESFPPPPQKREGRKVVRFADSLGLDLESVRYMMKTDLPPLIPSSAFTDLKQSQVNSYDIELVPDFIMPSLSSSFTERVRDLAVSLHSVSTANTTVYGIVAVMNLTFHKNIFIRYTVDGWNSHHDVNATYIQGSSEGDVDKFSFNIFVCPQDLSTRNHSLDFAVCYQTQDGKEFWDNNNDLNYKLKCEPKRSSFVSNINHSWIHFL